MEKLKVIEIQDSQPVTGDTKECIASPMDKSRLLLASFSQFVSLVPHWYKSSYFVLQRNKVSIFRLRSRIKVCAYYKNQINQINWSQSKTRTLSVGMLYKLKSIRGGVKFYPMMKETTKGRGDHSDIQRE